MEVIAHELTHGVVQNSTRLAFWGQAGALVESLCDVFGCLVKQYVNHQTSADADWVIGGNLMTPHGVHGVALRTLAAPGTAYDDPVIGKDPQPKDMTHYVSTLADNGGVHINSSIPSHAFYLVATNLGGHAWETAGRIWYDAMQNNDLGPATHFAAFARLTMAAAGRLFAGPGSTEAQAVRDAWKAVGVPL